MSITNKRPTTCGVQTPHLKFYFLALILSSVFSCNNPPTEIQHIDATLVTEISAWNDSIFFGKLADIEYSDNQFFLADRDANRVLVLDDQLQYIHHFGQHGPGPAEIRGIMNLEVNSDGIFVQDILGAKLLKYNRKFQLTDTLRAQFTHSEIALYSNRIIGQVRGDIESPFTVINTSNKEQEPISFGQKLERELGYPYKHLVEYKGLLLAFSMYNSAKVEVYDGNGNFLNATDLSLLNSDFSSWLKAQNIDQLVQSSTSRRRNLQAVYFDVVQRNDRFYLNTPPISINGKVDGIVLEVAMNDQFEFYITRIIHLNDYTNLPCFTMPTDNTILGFSPIPGTLKLYKF
mgnify:CR=1 FL=1